MSAEVTDDAGKYLEILADPNSSFRDQLNAGRWLSKHGIEVPQAPVLPEETVEDSVAPGIPRDTIPLNGERKARHRLALDDPKNLGAEFGILKWIFFDPELLVTLRDQLDPEDFTQTAHRLFLEAAIEAHTAGIGFDFEALAEELCRNVVFVETGGREMLARLATEKPGRTEPAPLLSTVRELANRRRAIAVARSIERSAVEGDQDIDELLSSAKDRIESLARDPLGAGWERPLIGLGEGEAPFPLEVFPDDLRTFIYRCAEVNHFPADYLAVPCLTVAGGIIGRTIGLRLKQSWVEFPAIYSAVIGLPGTVKTLGIEKISARPVREITARLRAEQRDAKQAWLAALAASGLRRGSPAADATRPAERIVEVVDITREALALALAANPRGILMIQDELSEWLAGMNQYKSGGGNDQQIFTKIWSFVSFIVDRVGRAEEGRIYVPCPFLGISAGIQPDILPELSTGRRDGFIDRWLLCYPPEVRQRWTEDDIDPDQWDEWTAAIFALWDRRPDFGPDDEPAIVTLTDKAKKRWADWYNAICDETADKDFDQAFRGNWLKFRQYCARLALILEQLHWAYGPQRSKRPCQVGAGSLDGAIAVIDYFKSHFYRIHERIRGGKQCENALAEAILRWIETRGLTCFTEAAVRDNFRRQLKARPQDLDDAIRWLVTRRAIRKMHARQSHRGRIGSARYEVNPLLSSKSAEQYGKFGTSCDATT